MAKLKMTYKDLEELEKAAAQRNPFSALMEKARAEEFFTVNLHHYRKLHNEGSEIQRKYFQYTEEGKIKLTEPILNEDGSVKTPPEAVLIEGKTFEEYQTEMGEFQNQQIEVVI